MLPVRGAAISRWAEQRGSISKIHLAVVAHGVPVRILVTAGTRADFKEAVHLIEDISLKYINTAEYPRNPNVDVKMAAIHRRFEPGESIKLISEDVGYTRVSIYNWRKRKKYLLGGIIALINEKRSNQIH